MAEFFSVPLPDTDMQQVQDEMRSVIRSEIAAQRALKIPAYNVADLPDASKYTNDVVRIIDNPQGTAVSNGQVWLSEVDGSNLGAGNG